MDYIEKPKTNWRFRINNLVKNYLNLRTTTREKSNDKIIDESYTLQAICSLPETSTDRGLK